MNRKIIYPLICCLLISATVRAQRLLGVATGNYLPTKSLFLNPALITDSRLKWSIDLFALNTLLDQNYGTIKSSGLINRLSNANSITLNEILTNGNTSFIQANMPLVDAHLLGVYFNIKGKHNLALTSRVRAFSQLRDFDKNIFNTLYLDPNTDFTINAQKLNQSISTWSDIGLTYSTTLYENGVHALHGGISLRYLNGIGFGGYSANNLNGSFYNAQDSVRVNNLDMHVATNINSNDVDFEYENAGDVFRSIFSGKTAGFGADLGFVYEYRPDAARRTYEMDGDSTRRDPEQNLYKLRISAAITDLGMINYRDANAMSIKGNGSFSAEEFSNFANDFDSLRAYMQSKGFSVDSRKEVAKLSMPTAIVIGADYHITKGFYVNGTLIAGLKPAHYSNYSPFTHSQFTLTPRWENRVITVGLPITYNMTTSNMKMGLGLRILPLYIGSDDLLALMGNGIGKGANFYFGLHVPIAKRRLKDTDFDKVSNKLDKCPTEQGEWAYMGCKPTDRDKDGIIDSLDRCPDIAGVASAQGCPDADLDGIADGEDLCVNEAGSIATKGCPDRDGDGVADKDDKCPDVAGEARFQGCMDTDGDGLGDWEDKCPEKAGSLANEGCPDSDNDGILDHLDRCPTVPGTAANSGCPEIRADVKKRLAFAATAIQFETGKAIIKPVSYKLLDEIVAILNEYSDYNMRIDGHTDDVGKDDMNMDLSKARAASVKEYFVSKGISTDRIETNGYGESKPKASNKTAKGRAQNRRVEMDLFLAN